MPRGRRARSHSSTGRAKSPGSSERASSQIVPGEHEAQARGLRVERIDVGILALVIGFALLLITSTGFANGQELWPVPDAIEYAAVAVNLDKGLGPVLHFAGNSYPPRYTIGYPLILAAAFPVLGHRPERLYVVTTLTACVAIVGLYLLTLWMFDRSSAVLAALFLATSPHFLGLSTCVMSDVPALAIVILAVLAFLYALESGGVLAAAVCGLLSGLAVTIRATDGALVAGMLAASVVLPRKLRFAAAAAFAIGFIVFPTLQVLLNLKYLGAIFSNGYAFWLPAFYESKVFRTFSLSYLVAPADPIYRHGNFVAYALAMLGLDGILGQLNLGTEARTLVHSHYSLYPFAVIVFAVPGVLWTMHEKRTALAARVMLLAGVFMALLLLFYLPYFHVEPRFMLPATFIVFAAAGFGLTRANRALAWNWAGFAVIALDVVLAFSILTETFSRLSSPAPAQSELVTEALAIRPRLSNAVLVSDISLQWLELIAGGPTTELVALNSRLYGRSINEKHVHWLYEKKAKGWSGPVPPTLLLPGGALDPAEARHLADENRQGRPVYLLIMKPLTNDWLAVLKQQFGEIHRAFSIEPVTNNPELALFRLNPS